LDNHKETQTDITHYSCQSVKSLAERLKEKNERLEKERLKRSGPMDSFSIRIPSYPVYIPNNGHRFPTDGDVLYIKKRAKIIVNKMRDKCCGCFYEVFKNAILEIDKEESDDQLVVTRIPVPPFVLPTSPNASSTNQQPSIDPIAPITDVGGITAPPQGTCVDDGAGFSDEFIQDMRELGRESRRIRRRQSRR
jgi:hypothetical protein